MEAIFGRDEIDKLEEIAAAQRDVLVDRIVAEFPVDKSVEALCFTLSMLFASAFTKNVEQQYDVAATANQVLALGQQAISWRIKPIAG